MATEATVFMMLYHVCFMCACSVAAVMMALCVWARRQASEAIYTSMFIYAQAQMMLCHMAPKA